MRFFLSARFCVSCDCWHGALFESLMPDVLRFVDWAGLCKLPRSTPRALPTLATTLIFSRPYCFDGVDGVVVSITCLTVFVWHEIQFASFMIIDALDI